jgi:hypothetical protein
MEGHSAIHLKNVGSTPTLPAFLSGRRSLIGKIQTASLWLKVRALLSSPNLQTHRDIGDIDLRIFILHKLLIIKLLCQI